jgi:2-dehydro-3-deoxygalactonokinase
MLLTKRGNDKKMIAIIDGGTTNTRLFILNYENKIVDRQEEKIGARDVAIKKTKKHLENLIKKMMKKSLDDLDINENDIQFVVLIGMICSEIGLYELPHIVAPAGVIDLYKNIHRISAEESFIALPLYCVRGIKNKVDNTRFDQIIDFDFMRGEETQAFGVINQLQPSLPVRILILSSHTKLIDVGKDAKIQRSITSLSGQTYEAIKKQTFIGKSLETAQSDQVYEKETFLEMISLADKYTEKYGFLRCLLLPRFMEQEFYKSALVRQLFIEAVFAVEDMKAITNMSKNRSEQEAINYILIGQKRRCQIYYELVKRKCLNVGQMRVVSDQELIDHFSVDGVLEILKCSESVF